MSLSFKKSGFPVRNRIVSPPREELDKLRQPLTPGEKLVFEFFDKYLSIGWEIYIQPHLNGLRPDFVLLNPDVGIAVFEVKDWSLDAMHYWVDERNEFPVLMARKDEKEFCLEHQNPITKVHQYKQEIFNLYCPRLAARAGFAVITSGVIFPFADDERVKRLFSKCLDYKGMSKSSVHNPVSGRNALRRGDIRSVFPEAGRQASFQMNESLAKDMRNWLIEPDASATQRQPLDLDKVQLAFVRSRTESGYRRIRGAAGSGKSLVLAARAAELLKQGKQVLIVTFNITLLHYLMDVAVRWPAGKGKTRSHATWMNFHYWCKRVCIENGFEGNYDALWEFGDVDNILNEKLPALVERVLGQASEPVMYDAVLVDEGQDFRVNWWSVLRMGCKPGGEMLLVADVTQDIYKTAAAWTDEVMSGAGFSGKWAELDISYRMPRLALEKAAEFAQQYLPEAGRLVPKSRQMAIELEPCDLRWVHAGHDCVVSVCCDEILRMFLVDGHQHYSVADVTFLCDSRSIGYEVVRRLGVIGIRCVHTYDPDDRQSRRQKIGFYMGDARVKATTLHSFKGWESRCLVVYADNSMVPQSLALLYTGLTRIKAHVEGSSLTVVSSCQALREYGSAWPDFQDIESPVGC